jgi:HicA toxin of bacterial toxin-antitoxin,
MNSRHRKTLEFVFEEPTKTNIPWADIESLLIAVGCKVREGSGSRVRFTSGEKPIAVHRPHPQKEAKQYVVRAIREFLMRIGVTP